MKIQLQQLQQIRMQDYHEFFASPILSEKENQYLGVEEVILLHNIRTYNIEDRII